MTSFFQRVLSKLFGGIPAPAPQPSVRSTRPQPVASKPAVAAAPAPAIPPSRPTPVALAARRPLMGANGQVAGFEFRIDDAALRALAMGADPVAQAAHVAAVLVAARLVAMDGRIGFARLPAAWLALAGVPKNDAGTVIGVEFDAAAAPLSSEAMFGVAAKVAEFRAVGAKLAWGAGQSMGSNPDFLLVRPGTPEAVTGLIAAVKAPPAGLTNIPFIATDMASVEDLERALQGGVRLASGSLTASDMATTLAQAGPLAPEAGRVALLISKLAAGADTAVIVGDIKGDIGVSVRLLQRMNSASYAHLGGISSIDQAVMLLGRNDLHRWLSLMLMQFAGSRQLSSALQEVALWRARLVELLAMERGESEPGRFFTLGLASMLGLILKMAPAEVVSTLSLPPEGAQALLSQSGPWFVYLRTALDVENQTASEASAAADGFTSAARVLELSSQAWAWAAENTVRASTPAA
ncbi:HDOD domain-containing protein [Rhodoferax sp.]|uniref:HDOD domain-containing protein n=1 Tax=Rhodoferax sp. TaxID=50421 RepID=UPI0025DCDF9F|nr:HDOD domain-containing protein [Rhodoferax sp.]